MPLIDLYADDEDILEDPDADDGAPWLLPDRDDDDPGDHKWSEDLE